MSLVYDALRQTPADTDGAAGRASQAAAQAWRPVAGHRRPVLWLLCGVLVAGPAGFLASRQAGSAATAAPATDPAGRATDPAMREPREFPPAAAAPTDAAAAQAQTPLAAASIAAAGTAGAALQAGSSASSSARDAGTEPQAPHGHVAAATPAQDASSATPAAAPAPAEAPAAAPPRTDVQVVASRIEVSVRKDETAAASPAAATEADPNAVRDAMAALHVAVGERDDAGADAALARLQSLLPAQSLTLLRARAWAAHGRDDHAEAERLYRAILERVPDDEHAGVNLALLDARRGEVAQARARLDRMASRNARSPQVQRALAELDAAAR